MRNTLTPLALALVAMALGACQTIGPGMYMSTLGGSEVEVPVDDNGQPITAKADITRITAEVVRDQLEQARQASYQLPPAPQEPYRRYRLGARDILSITVWDHPELTIPAGEFRAADQAGTVINEDGTIFYPYVGVVKAAGLTTEELRDTLTRRIARYIEAPQLDVRVAAYRSQKAYVVGEVKNPGIQSINDVPLTVTEAINRAGGVTEAADQRLVTLSRGSKVYQVDVQGIYERGDERQNVLLMDGDVLNVWDNELNKVFVLGEVGTQRSLRLNKGRLTLAEALGDAGGVDPVSSSPGKVFVIRGGRSDALAKPQIFHLDAASPDALLLADRFPLRPRDVVYVDTAPVTRWNRVISQILPTAQTLSASTATNFPLFEGQRTTQTTRVTR